MFAAGDPGHPSEHNRLLPLLALGEQAPANVRHFGAVGDGVTDDSAAIQAAFNSITNPNGGTVVFPVGTYRLASTVTSSVRGLVVRGLGGVGYNESQSTLVGASILCDAGVDGFVFNPTAASTIHQGPQFHNLNFHEKGEGKTSDLLTLKAVNRWVVRYCTFNGGANGLVVDAVDPGNPARMDVSWGELNRPLFHKCGKGLSIPRGTGLFPITGGEFTGCDTGIYLRPAGLLNTSPTVVGTKFDACAVGIDTQACSMAAFGLDLEDCDTAIKVSRDALLHADSGEDNSFVAVHCDGEFNEGIGFDIGAGCERTTIIAPVFSSIAAENKIIDNGAGTTVLAADRLTLAGKTLVFGEGGTVTWN